MAVTRPEPSQSGHGFSPRRPDPLQVGQMFSPVCFVPGASSSPGFFLSVSDMAHLLVRLTSCRAPGFWRNSISSHHVFRSRKRIRTVRNPKPQSQRDFLIGRGAVEVHSVAKNGGRCDPQEETAMRTKVAI